jgi:nucleoid DNA-binding protein
MKIDIDKVLSEIAVEQGITKFHAEMVYKSIFEMVAETMREGNADNILIPKFGKYIVPRKKLMIMNPLKHKEKYGS